MNRLRGVAAMLAIATVLVGAILLFIPSVGITAPIILTVGAACLAIVTPFDAREPAERKRVAAACFVHLLTTLAALGLVLTGDDNLRPAVVLSVLAAAAALLTLRAWRTRNRRRKAGWNDYFD